MRARVRHCAGFGIGPIDQAEILQRQGDAAFARIGAAAGRGEAAAA